VSSAFTGSETRFTIYANHKDMCRYSSKEDDGYRKVSHELNMLCTQIETRLSREDALNKQEQGE
jgi:hypothetical protein